MPARHRLPAAARDALFRALGHTRRRVLPLPAGGVLGTLKRADCIAWRGHDDVLGRDGVGRMVYSLTPRGRARAESIARGRILRATRAVARRHGIIGKWYRHERAWRDTRPLPRPRLAPWRAGVSDGAGRTLEGRLDADGTFTFEGPFETYGPRRSSLLDHVQVTITHDTATIPLSAFGAPRIIGTLRNDPTREREEVRVRTPDGTYTLYTDDDGNGRTDVTWRDGVLIAINGAPTRELIAGAFLVLASIGLGVWAVHAGLLGAHGTPPAGEGT
jgi:hypothetical protein